MFLPIGQLLLLIFAQPTVRSFWLGIPFVFLGTAIRLWSAGYLVKLKKLITAGPFALCRNPLYIGSFISLVGYLIMCNQLLAWFIAVPLFWLFHAGAVVYEEGLLLNEFGEEFLSYSARVPRFLPKFRSLVGNGDFSAATVLYNNEHRSAAIAILLCVVFGFFAYMPDFTPLRLLGR